MDYETFLKTEVNQLKRKIYRLDKQLSYKEDHIKQLKDEIEQLYTERDKILKLLHLINKHYPNVLESIQIIEKLGGIKNEN